MKDYIIKTNHRAIADETQRANSCLVELRNFVNAYNALRDEAEAMAETSQSMPALDTALLKDYLLNTDKIEKAYYATIKVPELAGVKVKLDTLDIEHADYSRAISVAVYARNVINKQRADINAFAVREQGTAVIVSDSWVNSLEEKFTEKAETEQEKALFDVVKGIRELVDNYEKTYKNEKIDLKKFEHAGFGSGRPEFADVFNQQKSFRF